MSQAAWLKKRSGNRDQCPFPDMATGEDDFGHIAVPLGENEPRQ